MDQLSGRLTMAKATRINENRSHHRRLSWPGSRSGAAASGARLLQSSAGRIVNVSRGAGQLSDTGTWSPAYAASKTTLNAITCLLAAALEDKGVAVNSVCPGWCRTEMGGEAAPRSAEEGAAGIVWLAADAPQKKTGLFWRDKKVITW